MMKRSEKELLREFVKLVQEDYGAYSYDGINLSMDAMGPGGAHFGSDKELYNIFIKPFTDVFNVAKGKTKEMSQRTQTLAKIGFEALATTLIPILADDYDQIFSEEREELQKIKSEYAEVYNATWDVLKDNDVVLAAFMYAPAAVLSYAFFQEAPKAALDLLSVLGGGTLDAFVQSFKMKFLSSNPSKNSFKKSEGPGMPFESRKHKLLLLNENDQSAEAVFKKNMKRKEVLSALESSPIVQRMQKQARNVVRDALTTTFERIKGIMAANTIEDLEKITKKQLPGADKLKKAPDNERKVAEQQLLSAAKQAAKKLYIKGIEDQVNAAVKSGVPKDNPWVADHLKVAQKIKAL